LKQIGFGNSFAWNVMTSESYDRPQSSNHQNSNQQNLFAKLGAQREK
jgi:hypothetical protein